MLLFVLLTALLDGMLSVPPGNWTVMPIRVARPGTLVRCTLTASGEHSPVHVILTSRASSERFLDGRSVRRLATATLENRATLSYVAEHPGEYLLVLDNRRENRSSVEVGTRIELVEPAARARTLPPERRFAVVLLSALFFLSVVAFSARKLMH